MYFLLLRGSYLQASRHSCFGVDCIRGEGREEKFLIFLHLKAIVITEPGNADVLKIRERPTPSPANGELLIRVEVAGVNRPDIAQRKGHYPAPEGVPADIPGLEVAGVVEKTGEGCNRWRRGDKVCALVAGGGYAEYCVAPEGQCLPIPEGLTMAQAASLPETFFTVWSNVFDRGRFRAGESFLVQGGTSGIGVAAIQMVKAAGGTVYATAGTDDKCAYCLHLGAEAAVNYKTHNFKDALQVIRKEKGIDVILDMIGGTYTPMHLELLAVEGRLLLINFMKGDETTIKQSAIMRKRLTITGSTLRARDAAFKSVIARKLEQEVWPKLASMQIKPVVYKEFSFEEAALAHEVIERSEHIGKLVLKVSH